MALYDFPPSRLLARRWSRYLRPTGPPTLPETPFRRAVLTTPTERPGACRSLPGTCCLPGPLSRSASASSLSRLAQGSLALRPAGSLDCPRQPLSRGFGRGTARPLASYQTDRHLSGWILLPLVFRAIVAHGRDGVGGAATSSEQIIGPPPRPPSLRSGGRPSPPTGGRVDSRRGSAQRPAPS
jgi:hypothetical protein